MSININCPMSAEWHIRTEEDLSFAFNVFFKGIVDSHSHLGSLLPQKSTGKETCTQLALGVSQSQPDGQNPVKVSDCSFPKYLFLVCLHSYPSIIKARALNPLFLSAFPSAIFFFMSSPPTTSKRARWDEIGLVGMNHWWLEHGTSGNQLPRQKLACGLHSYVQQSNTCIMFFPCQ